MQPACAHTRTHTDTRVRAGELHACVRVAAGVHRCVCLHKHALSPWLWLRRVCNLSLTIDIS